MRFYPGKRFWRRTLWLAAVALVLVLAGAATLRVPAVQTRLVRWAATHGEGWRLDVARVSMGLAGGEARGLVFSIPGVEARTEPGLELRVRPGRFLFGGRELHIERAAASGIRILVTPAEIEPSKTPFVGVLELLRSPLPWALGEAKFDAEVELRDAGADLATARMRMAGGGLAASRAGEFAYELEVASRLLPPGPEALVRSKGVARVTQDSAHGVAEIELSGDLRLPAYGPVKAPPGEFTLRIAQTPAGERYTGRIAWGGAAETHFSAEFDRAGRRIEGETEGRVDVEAVAWAGLDPAAWPSGGARWASTFSVGVDDARLAARLAAGMATAPELLVVETKDGAEAQVELRDLPLAWLGRWTEKLGLKFPPEGRANGAWRVTREGVAGARVESLRPLALGPLVYEDGLTPPLPAARVEVDFSATATAGRAELDLRSLRLAEADGAGAEARVAARAWWNPAEGNGGVDAARVEWRERAADAPVAEWTLGEALRVDASGRPAWPEDAVLGRFAVRGLSLDRLNRWAGGRRLAGRWAEGAGTVRAVDAAGGLALHADAPWRFTELKVEEAGGRVLFDGEISLRPEISRSGAGLWRGRVAELRVAENTGRGVTGELSGSWNEGDRGYAGEASLRATSPTGDLAPAAAGPLTVEARIKAGSVAEKVGQIEELALVVRGEEGELASLRSEGAWLYVQRPNGEVMANALAPWRLKTAALPLAWAREHLPPGVEMEGELQPMEWMLLTELGKYQVRPTRPAEVRGLSVTRSGEALVRDVNAAFYPGLDLRVAHALRPEFQFMWEASVHATDGWIDGAAGRALEFEAALGGVGNLSMALPKTLDLVARGDLAAWRAASPASAAQLPATGRFVARVDGDLLGAEPVEAWARIEGVPAAEGGRELAPLEIAARGKIEGLMREAGFNVALKMGEGPAARDLGFTVKLAPGENTLRIDSALRGRRWDLAETLAWASAWSGEAADAGATDDATHAAASAAKSGDTEAPRAATPLGAAVWGPLRGVFELEVGELLLAPYRVKDLRGRIEVDERTLAVRGLGGEMFAGRLGGELTLDYESGAEGGDHALAGKLRIEQFETARVVQEVFPNEYGLLDARVNLRATLRGRGFRLWDLVERAEADFAVNGSGVARLTHPDARTASTLLVMGGVITLSPELRALGRLLRKFAEMPVDDLRIEGGRSADGSLRLSRVRFDSPQARLEGAGEVVAVAGVPLPARPLALRLGLSARDETGLILGRMRLLDKKADAEGFRRLSQAIEVGGEAGRPDASAFYDLLARGAAGSRGTWGLIMRKVQREVERQQAKEAREAKEAAKS